MQYQKAKKKKKKKKKRKKISITGRMILISSIPSIQPFHLCRSIQYNIDAFANTADLDEMAHNKSFH